MAALLSTLIAATSVLTASALSRPAGADPVADLQAQARAVSQQEIEQQLRIGAAQVQFSVASELVVADSQALALTGQEIGADERQIRRATRDIRREAITAYIDQGTDSLASDAGLFTADTETAQSTRQYTSLVVGNVETTLDGLHAAQRSLEAMQATQRQQQAQDRSDQAQKTSALGQAESTERQLGSLEAQVTGRLAAAVAQQAAAQDAAAAAAVAAARSEAARATADRTASARLAATARTAPAATQTPTAAPPASSADPADPVLNPFLQCVVQAESGGDYSAVSPNGLYMGAFQFSQSTWNLAAQDAGLPGLVGVPPNLASEADQDAVAVALYALDGEQPWLGDRCSS